MKLLDKNYMRGLNPYQDIEEIERKKDKYFKNVQVIRRTTILNFKD